jgi:hypothetical protein
MIGKAQFLLFPVMILFMALILALASTQLLAAMPMDQMLLALHAVMTLYGLVVGGFALFGEDIANRRFGQVVVLLQSPIVHPVSFRTIFLAFYVKDIIYYLAYSILPLVGGIALSIPFTGFRLASVLLLLLTATLSFLLGLSFSFFLSSIYVRWRLATIALLGGVAAVLLAGPLTGLYGFGQALPAYMLQNTSDPFYILLSAALVLALSAAAVLLLRVKPGVSTTYYEERLIPTVRSFGFAKGNQDLTGKDWVDLIRSRTVVPIASAYVGPLLFLALLFWLVESAASIRIPVNLAFYAAMIGFFSVSVYGWLNLLDNPGFLEVMPVTVSQAVRAKLLLLHLFAVPISTVFLAALALARDELGMLPVALLVGYATTAYTVCATAYLTGLRTNSYLFDPRILARFSLLCIPPPIALVILSFGYDGGPLTSSMAIGAVCAALLALSAFLYRRIEARWGRSSFAP